MAQPSACNACMTTNTQLENICVGTFINLFAVVELLVGAQNKVDDSNFWVCAPCLLMLQRISDFQQQLCNAQQRIAALLTEYTDESLLDDPSNCNAAGTDNLAIKEEEIEAYETEKDDISLETKIFIKTSPHHNYHDDAIDEMEEDYKNHHDYELSQDVQEQETTLPKKKSLVTRASDRQSCSPGIDQEEPSYSGYNIDKSREYGSHAPVSRFSKYICKTCDLVFSTRHSWSRHQLSHTEDRPFACKQCGQKFKRKVNLFQHSIKHAQTQCEECDKKFRKPSELEIHKAQAHSAIAVCKSCNLKFVSAIQLEQHVCSHTVEESYACDQCNIAFKSKDALRKHKIIHSDTLPEDKCSDTSIRKAMISGLKSYNCPECTFRCTLISKLKAHLKEHSNQSSLVILDDSD